MAERRIRWRLRHKLGFVMALAITLVMGLVGGITIRRERALLLAKAEREGRALVESLAISCTNTLMYQDLGLLEEGGLLDNYINQLMESKQWNVRYAIILDQEGRVLAHNDLREYGKRYEDPLGRAAVQAPKTLAQSFPHPHFGDLLEVSTPLAISSKRWGTLRVGFSLEAMKRELRLLYAEIALITLGLILLSFLVIGVISKTLTDPLTGLARAIGQTTVEGETPPLVVKSQDEIGYLAGEFESLTARLREAHKRLKEAQRQLIQSEKLASVGKLAAGVAHEINNPLDGVENCLRAVMREPENQTQSKEYLAMALEALYRIEGIVRRLLEYSRLRPLKIEPLDLNEVVEKSLGMVDYRLVRQGIKLEKRFEAGLPTVHGDFHQLEQVFLNISLNAVDAMPKGGTLTVSTSNGDRRVSVEIRDTGCGIPEENLAKVFDPFFTTKEVGEGTGLGLAVSLGIVEEHQGKIEVESKPGVGTLFRVLLLVEKPS